MARIYGGENRADSFLFFVCGMKLFGICRCALWTNPGEYPFVMCAASLATEPVNAGANSNAIEPRFHIFMLRFLIAPQFQKNFHGEFFGAAAIADDAFDDAGDSRIVGAKKRFDIKWRGCGVHVGNGFAGCVHDMHNAARKDFMTGAIGTLNRIDCTACACGGAKGKGAR